LRQQTISTEVLTAALEALEAKRDRITEQIAEIKQVISGGKAPATGGSAASAPAPAKRKRHMSAAGRKRIADAARKRWAALREQKASASPEGAPAKKAGRKKVAGRKPGRPPKAKAKRGAGEQAVAAGAGEQS
jgi:hypothetical protein